MKSIIGNNKGRRKPLDLTGKILADAQSYKKNPSSNLETKTNKSPIVQPSGNLSFVTDENLYKEFSKYLKIEHPNVKNNLSFRVGVMRGSSTYLATAMDMYLKSINSESRLATSLDLEQDLELIGSRYADSGLALRNLADGLDKQAIHLARQLKATGFPFFFNLKGLELDKNLNFNLTEESFYKTAECLNWPKNTTFSKVNEFGLPLEKDENSKRVIETGSSALCCVSNSLDIFETGTYELGKSSSVGRIVLAKENKK